MKRKNQKSWLIIMVILMSSGFAAWSSLRLDQAQSRYETATRSLDESKKYAQQISTHAQAPRRVSETEMELTLLARLVERAADEAGIERRALDRIWPQPARRVGDTAYQRKATQLVVRNVTLPQAVAFLHGLATADTPLSIDGVRLSAPPGSGPTMTPDPSQTAGNRAPGLASGSSGGSEGGDISEGVEVWTLEATVSHLLYQPAAAANAVARRK